jgi:hypothetical protein
VTELQVDTDSLGHWDAENAVTENDSDGSLEMDGLPKGFGKIFARGLGLRRDYRGVIHNIEEHTQCTIVRFSRSAKEGPDGRVFYLALDRFRTYRNAVDLNRNRATVVARRVNVTVAHNAVADLLGLERRTPTVGRNPVVQAMTRELTGQHVLDAGERKLLVQRVTKESRAAATEAPQEFGLLRRDIELVSLEVLIGQFEKAMIGHSNDEKFWQKFFQANTFALQQLFAAPVALYAPQLTVKSNNALGSGARIADFVLVNTITRSGFVVEIKTPGAKLTENRAYRGAGGAEVYLPHGNLLGAVTQVQAQLESAQIHLPELLRQTPDVRPLETYVVRGAVIVGTAGTLSSEQKASYQRYRAGLGNVDVIGFDEVLDRLKIVHGLLVAEASSTET